MNQPANAALLIAVSEARHACKGIPDLKERVRAAMKATANHWMVTDEDGRFRSAVAAALMESEGEERERLQAERDALGQLSAILLAAQNGLSIDPAGLRTPENPVGLMDLWREVTGITVKEG